MSETQITLPADLAAALKTTAESQGLAVDTLIRLLLSRHNASVPDGSGWAAAVGDAMTSDTDITWQGPDDLSERGSQVYREALYRRWQKSQSNNDDDSSTD